MYIVAIFTNWCVIQWVTSLFGLVFRWDQTSDSRPNLIQKVKWRFWIGLSQSLSENFRWVFHWVRTLDSAIRSAKVNVHNSVLVQFTLHAVDSLIPQGLTIAERKLTSLFSLTLFVNKHGDDRLRALIKKRIGCDFALDMALAVRLSKRPKFIQLVTECSQWRFVEIAARGQQEKQSKQTIY